MRNLLICIVGILAIGCGGKKESGEAEPSTGSESNEPASRSQRVELSRPSGGGAKIPVTFELPAGWRATKLEHWFVPADDENMTSGSRIVLSSGCQGSCDPDAIPGNIDQMIANIKKTAARPNLNTGDPERDAIRGTFELIEERDLTHGKLLAYRVTYSDEILASGPYQQAASVRCFLHRPGDRFFIEISGSVALADEKKRLPDLLSACESAIIAEPAAAAE